MRILHKPVLVSSITEDNFEAPLESLGTCSFVPCSDIIFTKTGR